MTHDLAADPADPADQVDAATGLRRRPEMAPDILAAVTAAAQQLTAVAPAEPAEADTSHLAWRFSGRWWSRPLPARRARPYPTRRV